MKNCLYEKKGDTMPMGKNYENNANEEMIPLEKLNVIDNFMFNELASQKDKENTEFFFRYILETILGKKINHIEIMPQKVVQGETMKHHGVQFDVYIEEYTNQSGENVTDAEQKPNTINAEVKHNTIYDIEPNKYKDTFEPKRARFYHSVIDRKLLESGKSYDKLKSVVVIFIMTKDPFNLNRMIYTVQNCCIEAPYMNYDDGAVTLYLYTRGECGEYSDELKALMKFIEQSTDENADNSNLKKIRGMMHGIASDVEVGDKYMQQWDYERHIKDEAFLEGREEGKAEGKAEGKEEGKAEGKAEAIIILLKTKGEVSDELSGAIKREQNGDKVDMLLLKAMEASTVDEFVKNCGII